MEYLMEYNFETARKCAMKKVSVKAVVMVASVTLSGGAIRSWHNIRNGI